MRLPQETVIIDLEEMVQMESSNWYKIDNVAKVVLATIGKRDTRAMRVTCIL